MTCQHFLLATFSFSTYKFHKGAETLLHEASSVRLYLHCSGPHGHWNSMLTVFLLMNIMHIFKAIFTWLPIADDAVEHAQFKQNKTKNISFPWICFTLQNNLKQFFCFYTCVRVFFGVMLQVSSHLIRCFLFKSLSISQGFT